MPNANSNEYSETNASYNELSDLRDYLTETLTGDDCVHCEDGEYYHELWLTPADIKWIIDQINNEANASHKG